MTPSAAAAALRLVALLFLGFGVIAALVSSPSTAGPGILFLDVVKWPVDGDPGVLGTNERWFGALLGGATSAFAVLTLLVVAPAVARGDHSAARGALAAIAAWLVVDSAGSIVSGVVSNALFNLLFAALYAFPLLALKPFRGGQ